jgi:sec-independent protein translocase protein TatB
MFGISLPELLIVGVIALIFLGPERLPVAARTFGSLLGQIRKQSDAVRRELYNSVYTPADEMKKEIDGVRSNLKTVKSEIASAAGLTIDKPAKLEENLKDRDSE